MKVVVVFSGGLDSTVLLHHFAVQGHECHALSICYGQRHQRELSAASHVHHRIRDILAIPEDHFTHQTLMLPQLRNVLGGSSQTSPDVAVPHGHYAEESMKKTVVPNRNMILLSMAIGYGVSLRADAVVYGAHKGDHAIYPDCRPEFVKAMQLATELCDYEPPKLLAPFIYDSKAQIVARGAREGAPMYLSYSCYAGDQQHCGKCGTCVERREAFQLAGVADPTIYES